LLFHKFCLSKLPKFSLLLNLQAQILPKIAGLDDHTGGEVFRAEADAMGIKMGDFMMPVRMTVTGSRISPPLVGSIQILGIEKAIKRIEKAIAERF